MNTHYGLLFLAVSALWVTSEITLIFLCRSKSGSRDHDEGSLKWLNIIIYSCVALAVSCGFMGLGRIRLTSPIIPWFGLCIIVVGLVIRWTAILILRKFFTTNVVIQANHRIIKTGLYRIIRHPSYTGAIISFWGLGLAFSNWLSIIILVVPITIAFLKRIRLEEKALLSAFGEEYSDYRKTTWILFPWIY